MAETPPLDREFTITRVFDAPRELVWQAWTDPEHMSRWFGPHGFTTPLATVTMDVRPGGTFEFTMVSDDDGNEIPSGGTFLEVVEPERLVWRDRDIDLLVTVTFADLGEQDRDDVPRRRPDRRRGGVRRLVDHVRQAGRRARLRSRYVSP